MNAQEAIDKYKFEEQLSLSMLIRHNDGDCKFEESIGMLNILGGTCDCCTGVWLKKADVIRVVDLSTMKVLYEAPT